MAMRHTRSIKKTANVSSLTDNTTGTVSNTLSAIPDSGGGLITDLITGLNTNTLPAIRNDIASLSTKLNTIITALQRNGIL